MIGEKSESTPLRRNPWSAIIVVLLIAIAVRTWIAANTYLISTDSALLLRMASDMKAGEFGAALSHEPHPLYPAGIAGLSSLTGLNLETCGVIISIALGSLMILPLYFIARELFGPLSGIFAALILTFHLDNARLSADIKTDTSYIFLLLCGAAALLRGMKRPNLFYFAACGIASGLAYLVRPEGFGLMVLAVVYLVVCRKTALTKGRRGVAILIVALTCLIVAAPYMIYIQKNSGGLNHIFTKKKSLLSLIGLKTSKPSENAPESERERLEKILYLDHTPRAAIVQLVALLNEFVKTIGVFGLAALTGAIVLLARGQPAWGNVWLVLIAALYSVVAALLAVNVYNWDIPDQRHLLPIATVCLAWAGYGLEKFTLWSKGLLARRMPAPAARAVPLVFLVLAFGAMWMSLLGPRRADQLGQRCAADIISAQGLSSPVIMTSEEKIPYYASGKKVKLPSENNPQVTAQRVYDYAKICGVAFIVVSERDAKKSFTFLDPQGKYDKEHFELLGERADEACIKKRYGMNVVLKDSERYLVYKVKY